ncbi:diaminopimelate epimerase [bacterium]|nr:diaminopimelate epimerase [candidate division CSSED10-310 bacterium]
MILHFTKWHGLGNDYIFFDGFDRLQFSLQDAPRLAIEICRRHRGVGADGIVLVLPDSTCEALMKIYNADGTEAEICGNALRCVAKMLWKKKYTLKKHFTINTLAGIIPVKLLHDPNGNHRIDVSMGKPRWKADEIPFTGKNDPRQMLLDIDEITFDVTCLSVGNPHCILFCSDPIPFDMINIGTHIQSLTCFPNSVNVGFCRVQNRQEINLTVFERGSGLTQACGSGATAAFAACRQRNLVEKEAKIRMPGGSLDFYEAADGSIHMIGEATEVFSGNWLFI